MSIKFYDASGNLMVSSYHVDLDDTAGGTDGETSKAPTSNAMYDGLLTKVDTSGTPVDNDYAKFTDGDTIEGRSCLLYTSPSPRDRS